MYSQSATPLVETSPVGYTNEGGFGFASDTMLTEIAHARAHSRRNLAVAGFSKSASQRVFSGSACAGVDGTSIPAAATASVASVALILRCMVEASITRR